MGSSEAMNHLSDHVVFWALHLALLVLLPCCHGKSSGLCIPSEREALLSFKRDLTDPSSRLSSWVEEPHDADCCHWHGVICHNSTGHVLQLRLGCVPLAKTLIMGEIITGGNTCIQNAVLGGKMSPSLLNLKHLTYLDLSNNDFRGTPIPSFLGSLRNLRYLNLSSGGFGGMIIPQQLGNLSDLQTLDLGDFLCPRESSPVPEWIFSLQSLTSLSLSNNRFHGPIPKGLHNLTGLKILDLSRNSFTSSLPRWLFDMSKLEVLNLSSNSLKGGIVEADRNMTAQSSLSSLDLSNNPQLGEGVQTVQVWSKSLENLCSLRRLKLSGIELGRKGFKALMSLSGCVLPNLVALSLDETQLTGLLSDLIDKLAQSKNLAFLDLSSNSLHGPIPVSIGRLTSLEVLNVGVNELSGTLPESLGQLARLRELTISHNPVEGDVTEVHFSNLTKLIRLEAIGNNLRLRVGPKWVPPFQVQDIYLESWQIGPYFPQWLQSQKSIRFLQLSGVGISSTIPYWFRNTSFPCCSHLNLSRNKISGEVNNALSFSLPGSSIDLGSNRLSGPLPPISPNLKVLDLSNNSINGSISHFLCHKTSERFLLEFLNLGRNYLSGEIPDCWMNWRSLGYINFDHNEFTGQIPCSIGFLRLLRSLHLRNNHLTGELPTSLGNCTLLIALDLSENDFWGRIPSWMGENLASLMLLMLGSNRFYGKIPLQLCHLTALQVLVLAHNNLSGVIPACVGSFLAMVVDPSPNTRAIQAHLNVGNFLEHASVVFKGHSLDYSMALALLKTIDLSDNCLSGGIPSELTALLGLRAMNLSRNRLVGQIPATIGAMPVLESIDFSTNQLSGEIPSSLSDLLFLCYLNLSNNKLEGKIPLGTQLQSFDASAYQGNRLCGPPLPDNCTISTSLLGVKSKGGVRWDGMKVDGFNVIAASGFIVGFWAVWAPLLFEESWRLAYFEWLNGMWRRICPNSYL